MKDQVHPKAAGILVWCIAASLLLPAAGALAAPAPEVHIHIEGKQVLYLDGTIPGLTAGTVGVFDWSSAEHLAFDAKGTRFQIPYQRVTNVSYEEKRARRLGVITTLIVRTLKPPRRRHFLTIGFTDDAGVPQVAVLELAKDGVRGSVEILNARSPRKVSCGALPCQPQYLALGRR
jgi:hypothetical protein